MTRRMLLGAFGLSLGGYVHAQDEVRMPKFEVASVKPSDPGRPSIDFRMEHGELSIASPVRGLIVLAFDLENGQVRGEPEWTLGAYFDIKAKGDPAAGPDQIKAMLQGLLAERFGLRYRRESSLASGFILSADGHQHTALHKAKAGTLADGSGLILSEGDRLRARGVSMDRLCKYLWMDPIGKPVVDKTGLKGSYDIDIAFDDPNLSATPATEAGSKGTIFTALRTLGLRLEAAKVPVDFFVIEQIERPSEN